MYIREVPIIMTYTVGTLTCRRPTWRFSGFRTVVPAPGRCRRCKRRFTAVARPDVVCTGPPVHAAGQSSAAVHALFGASRHRGATPPPPPRCACTGVRVFVRAWACVRAGMHCIGMYAIYRVSEMRSSGTSHTPLRCVEGALKSERRAC